MSKFPFDALTDILCRLPPKTLLRFRCLSKPCCSLIDSPGFIKLHLNHSIKTNSNRSLIVEDTKPYGSLYEIDVDSTDKCPIALDDHPFEPSLRGFSFYSPTDSNGWIMEPRQEWGNVFGCCNGLLALCYPASDMTLWNPSTRRHRILPNFWGKHQIGDHYLDGFGYDAISDDYKVIRIIQRNPSKRSIAMVYSLKANSLRRIEDFPYYTIKSRHPGVFVGHSLHWVVHPRSNHIPYNVIVALDISEEKFHIVPMPDRWGLWCRLHVGVLGECLALSCVYDERIEIWTMKEYGAIGSWTKICSFENQQLEEFQKCRIYMKPLGYSKTCNEVIVEKNFCHLCWEKHDFRHLCWYDIERESVRKVVIPGGVRNRICAHVCVRSLVPLNFNAGEAVQSTMPKRTERIKGEQEVKGECWDDCSLMELID